MQGGCGLGWDGTGPSRLRFWKRTLLLRQAQQEGRHGNKMSDPFISIKLTMRVSDWEKLLATIETAGQYPIVTHFVRNELIEYYRNEDLKELARSNGQPKL